MKISIAVGEGPRVVAEVDTSAESVEDWLRASPWDENGPFYLDCGGESLMLVKTAEDVQVAVRVGAIAFIAPSREPKAVHRRAAE